MNSMKRRRSRLDPARIAAVERQRQALAFRCMGCTFVQIAAAVGYSSKQAAHKAVQSAMHRYRPAPPPEARTLELERVDQLFSATYPQALAGDLQAVAVALRLMEFRADLLGLHAPVRREVTGSNGQPLASATQAAPLSEAHAAALREALRLHHASAPTVGPTVAALAAAVPQHSQPLEAPAHA